MSLVWDQFKRGGSEKLVMLAMADWCNDQGLSLHPSHDAVAEKCCISRSQAVRVVRGLVEDGFLEVIGNHFGGAPGTTRQYRLAIEKLRDSVDATPTDSTSATGSADATGSTDASRGVAPMRETGSADATQTTIEPSIEPPVKSARKKSKKDQKLELLAGVDSKVAEQYLEIRKEKKLPLTELAVDMIKAEAALLNWTLEQAIRKCCEKAWAGFKAQWVLNEQKEQAAQEKLVEGKPWYITASGIEAKAAELKIIKGRDEVFPEFKARVYRAAKITPEMVRQANIDHGARA